MKRLLFIFSLMAFGALLGTLIASRLTRYIPICGEDCAAEAFSMFLAWTGAGIILFATFGIIWSRKPRLERTLVTLKLVILTVVFSLAGSGVYLYKLEQENAYLYSIREIQPTTDFSEIVIAQQQISVFAGEPDGRAKLYYTIAAWERCALGASDSKQRPPRIEIACRKGIGWIPKTEEIKLVRVERNMIFKK